MSQSNIQHHQNSPFKGQIQWDHGETSKNRTIIVPTDTPDIQIPEASPGYQNQTQKQNNNQQPATSPSSTRRTGFLVYPEKVINEGLTACQNSILGKIITEKPIHFNSIQNGIDSIWGAPNGLKIQEIDKGILQFFVTKRYDYERILLGNPWIFRNAWLIVKPWDRKTEPSSLDFTHAPVCIQIWGLPAHCKTKQMGNSIGSLLGDVETTDIYEYPGKKSIVKIKVNIDVHQPIQSGILIGNHKDGTHWIDFRYENLPQVCFRCGILGHSDKLCMNEPNSMENQAPLGPWIRSNQYGRRIIEEKDKRFHSNPSQGSNFGHYSPPIPASMMEQMAAMKLQEEAEKRDQAKTETPTYQTSNNGMQLNRYRRQTPRVEQINLMDTMVLDKAEETQVHGKRPRLEADHTNTKNITMA
jgi:hypothetical protein